MGELGRCLVRKLAVSTKLLVRVGEERLISLRGNSTVDRM